MVESGEAFRDMRERLGACFPELSVQETERLASALRDEGLPAAVIGRAVPHAEKSVIVK